MVIVFFWAISEIKKLERVLLQLKFDFEMYDKRERERRLDGWADERKIKDRLQELENTCMRKLCVDKRCYEIVEYDGLKCPTHNPTGIDFRKKNE
jgi:hypothetical protein